MTETAYGEEFRRRQDGVVTAPEKVRAVQYRIGSGFEEKYIFLKFVNGLGVTIYADGLVVQTDQGKVRILDGDWILREGQYWYFLKDDDFKKTYDKVA